MAAPMASTSTIANSAKVMAMAPPSSRPNPRHRGGMSALVRAAGPSFLSSLYAATMIDLGHASSAAGQGSAAGGKHESRNAQESAQCAKHKSSMRISSFM